MFKTYKFRVQYKNTIYNDTTNNAITNESTICRAIAKLLEFIE